MLYLHTHDNNKLFNSWVLVFLWQVESSVYMYVLMLKYFQLKDFSLGLKKHCTMYTLSFKVTVIIQGRLSH